MPDELPRSNALEEWTMIRRLAAAVAALALLLSLTVPVLAGGWAEIVADAQTTEPPVEGQPLDVGFVVLQHGETPAGWETATVHFTNASTGQTIDVTATNDRPDGHFVATATLPAAGDWTWRVTLKDLASDHAPVALTVKAATGQAAAADAVGLPLIAVLALVVLIGAVAAFAIAWRARRTRSGVKVSPAPRGADPA
jgi:hypothetical protein